MGELPKISIPINDRNHSDNISIQSNHGTDIYNSDTNSDSEIDIEKGLTYKKRYINPQSNDNQPWNYKIILFLKKVGTKTMGYRWMYDHEAEHFEHMDDLFKIIEIVLLAILGLLTSGQLITLIVTSGAQYKIAWIVVTAIQLILVLIYAIVKGIHDTMEYPREIFRCNYSALKFGGINLDIQNQLALNLSDRDTDKVFLKNITKSFNDAIYTAPKLQNRTKKQYLKNIEDDDVFQPLQEDSMGNIRLVIQDKKDIEKDIDDDKKESKRDYQVERWLKHF